jgi:hypothetical protein
MSILADERLNVFQLNDLLWMVTHPTGTAIYDFPFEQFFHCHHPWQLPAANHAVARVGARPDYAAFYDALAREGIRLIHSPAEQTRCSELPHWYPLISDITPRSHWYTEMPDLETVMRDFEFPVFIKGARQTSKHQKHLSIIEDADSFRRLQQQYADDPILHWQAVVCREYVPLRQVAGGDDDTIPPAFEFRTFWWKGACVGAGRYWYAVPPYDWTTPERQAALAVAREAARKVNVPFLVVDVAQRADGQWIVIECNDGQESGYAGVSPFALWKSILTIESQPDALPE